MAKKPYKDYRREMTILSNNEYKLLELAKACRDRVEFVYDSMWFNEIIWAPEYAWRLRFYTTADVRNSIAKEFGLKEWPGNYHKVWILDPI